MSEEEVYAFAQSPSWRSKVRVRMWDDRAKTQGAEVPGLETYRELLTAHISRQKGGN